MKKKIALEPAYAATFAKFAEKKASAISAVPKNKCVETIEGDRFIAYNPHTVRTFTSRGQWLDPGVIYVGDDKTGESLVLMDKDGGTTLNGGTTGPRDSELLSIFSNIEQG